MSHSSAQGIIDDILPSSHENGYELDNNNDQSNTNLLAEAAESIQHNDFEKRVAEAADGEELNNLLESLPYSVYSNGQSLTYNRVIKVLIREGLIDSASVVAWNRASKVVKNRVYDVIRKVTVVTPNDVLLKMKAAALKKDVKKVKRSSKLTKEERFQLDCRTALLTHSVIDPAIQPLLIEIFSSNNQAYTADDILALINSKLSSYSNIFPQIDVSKELQRHHPELFEINPSLGTITSGDNYLKLLKVLKVKYDDLIDNISKMINHSNETITPDQSAFQLTYKDGNFDFGLVYCYFMWKNQEVGFIPSSGTKVEFSSLSSSPTLLKRKRVDRISHGSKKPLDFSYNSSISPLDITRQSHLEGGSISTSDDEALGPPTSEEQARLREQAYVNEKTAAAHLMNVRAEIEARNAALSDRSKEIEMLRNAINDKSFEKLNLQQQTQLQSKYSDLLMQS